MPNFKTKQTLETQTLESKFVQVCLVAVDVFPAVLGVFWGFWGLSPLANSHLATSRSSVSLAGMSFSLSPLQE
eukprot:3520209-Amphidinium_carterae.1